MPSPLKPMRSTARSLSDPARRTVRRGLRKPARLNVQVPSAASAVASEPNMLSHLRPPTTSGPAVSSYCRASMLGRVQRSG
jgi:hypothetical protein